MHCGFSLCLSEEFTILRYVYLLIWGFILVEGGWGEEVLHLHSYTDFRRSTNPLNWHTEWCMFVSICVFLVMAFVISKTDRGRQKLNIDPHDDLLLTLFGLRIQMYISVCWAKLIICFMSMETSSVWTPSPHILFRALRNGESKCSLHWHCRRSKPVIDNSAARVAHNF